MGSRHIDPPICGKSASTARTGNRPALCHRRTAAEVSTDGQRIALTFDEILDHPTYTTTIRSAFTVTVDGTGTSVQSTSGGMAKVNLSVGRAISAGQTVVVSYDQSAAGTEALGDSDGNKVADFTTGRDGIPAVVNNSAVDRSPPELTGATVASSGVAIELAFDEDLDLPATIPAALKDAFSVTAAGDTVEIAGLAADGSSGLQIALSSRILKDQAVVVSYDRSAAGTNALDDAAGNEVVDFTTGASGVPAVDNDSTQLSADATLSGLSVSGQQGARSAGDFRPVPGVRSRNRDVQRVGVRRTTRRSRSCRPRTMTTRRWPISTGTTWRWRTPAQARRSSQTIRWTLRLARTPSR